MKSKNENKWQQGVSQRKKERFPTHLQDIVPAVAEMRIASRRCCRTFETYTDTTIPLIFSHGFTLRFLKCRKRTPKADQKAVRFSAITKSLGIGFFWNIWAYCNRKNAALWHFPYIFRCQCTIACVYNIVQMYKLFVPNLNIPFPPFLYSDSTRIKWTLNEMRRQPASVLFSRLQAVGGTRDDAVTVPSDKDRVFLAPTVAIRVGSSNINVR